MFNLRYFYSNSGHLRCMAGLADTILEREPRTITAKFGLILQSDIRDLNLKSMWLTMEGRHMTKAAKNSLDLWPGEL